MSWFLIAMEKDYLKVDCEFHHKIVCFFGIGTRRCNFLKKILRDEIFDLWITRGEIKRTMLSLGKCAFFYLKFCIIYRGIILYSQVLLKASYRITMRFFIESFWSQVTLKGRIKRLRSFIGLTSLYNTMHYYLGKSCNISRRQVMFLQLKQGLLKEL